MYRTVSKSFNMHQMHQCVRSNLPLNFMMWNSHHDLRRGDYDASRLLKLRKQLLELGRKIRCIGLVNYLGMRETTTS